jgi:iron-sulfur cluster assembly accessory protein
METKTQILNITSPAAAKLKALVAQEPNPEQMALRLEVQPGGCAGFRYGLFFDDQIADSDIIEETEGIKVAIDPMSAPYLRGVVIDWGESLQQSGFVINNPNAQGRCACGDSFH